MLGLTQKIPMTCALEADMNYAKYHALGNDYLVIRPQDLATELTDETTRRICHRNYGLGSDGILLGPLESTACDFGLRILNPDGSEAEKSGNGLRIFARFLWDEGLVQQAPFTVETLGGAVRCEVQDSGQSVRVEMGRVSFQSEAIPVKGESREVINEEMDINEETLTFCAATVGNPHCVVLVDTPTQELAHRLGPKIETDPRFPARTNVQFMKVIDRNRIQIEIWERGAGYTLASGSSSTAAAAVAHRLGECDAEITVEMPGGLLSIAFDTDFAATMTGPVTKVSTGVMAEECLSW